MPFDDPPQPDTPYDILEPQRLLAPVVFSSPHSGRVYPPGFLAATRLDLATLRRSEDAFVDELFFSVAQHGMPLIRAHFPRSFVDLNREPYELDPRMFEGRVPHYANTRSMRVAGGLGTIARVVGDAQEIYEGRIAIEDALFRIESYYKPYHKTLRRLLARAERVFGVALLVDCHSMPSAASAREDRPRADVIIGDRYGTSTDPQVSDLIEALLRDRGYSVVRNKPYAGGFITEHYGQPGNGVHAVQLEINRGLYMDEKTLEKRHGFADLAADLDDLARELADLAQGLCGPLASAAE